MQRYFKWIVILVVIVSAALMSVAITSAQEDDSQRGERGGEGEQVCGSEMLTNLGLSIGEIEAARETRNREAFEALLADNGITTEDIEQARETCINEAVAAGEITQEQAERMLQGPQGRPGGQRRPSEAERQAIADALNLSLEELQQAYEDGISLEELAERRGVDFDVLREELDLNRGPRGRHFEELAQALNFESVEALREALDNGATIEALAEEAGVDLEAFREQHDGCGDPSQRGPRDGGNEGDIEATLENTTNENL